MYKPSKNCSYLCLSKRLKFYELLCLLLLFCTHTPFLSLHIQQENESEYPYNLEVTTSSIYCTMNFAALELVRAKRLVMCK